MPGALILPPYGRQAAIDIPLAASSASAANVLATSIVNSYRQAAGAQNDLYLFDLLLAAGTYSLAYYCLRGVSSGVHTITLDGTVLGTVEGYNAGGTIAGGGSWTGAVVRGGLTRLSIQTLTKNASSSAYHLLFAAATLVKTA